MIAMDDEIYMDARVHRPEAIGLVEIGKKGQQ